nr:L,D-transpeptidase [Nitrospirota bacterium]
MNRSRPMLRIVTLAALAFALGMTACVQKAPPELVQAVESLDRELTAAQGAEFAPEEYAKFVEHWTAVRGRMLAEPDVIRLPWEPNRLVADLLKVQEQGVLAVSTATQRREAEHQQAESRLIQLEERLQTFTGNLDTMGGRVVLGRRPVETELLAKQARSFFEQGQFARSQQASQQAAKLLDHQIERLGTELGRYADERRVRAWRSMVSQTVNWSHRHHRAAIVVSKADRRLFVYRHGKAVASYPVSLGYNGILEKRYQGDGATPEGQYRIVRKRDRGDTKFYRALLLDYPNGQDRRRFQQARAAGILPPKASIGGQIEIHGGDNRALSETLGCVQMENRQIDALFDLIEEGDPVTIVGALGLSNAVSLALAELEQTEEG